jgi:hypothetical protein
MNNINTVQLLKAEPYHFFTRTVMNRIFIDSTLNPGIAAMREEFLNFSGFSENDSFFMIIHPN